MFRTYSHLIFRQSETPETPIQSPTPEKTIVEFKNRIKVIKDNVLIAKNLVVTKRLDLLDYKISEAQKHLERVDNKDGQDNSFQNLLKGKGLRSDVGQERKGEKLLQDVEIGLVALEKEFGIEKKVTPQMNINIQAEELAKGIKGDPDIQKNMSSVQNEKDPKKQEEGLQGILKDIQHKADDFLKNNTKLSPSERSNVMMLATAAALFRGAPKARDMIPFGFIGKTSLLAAGYFGYQAVGGNVITDRYNKTIGSSESSSTGGVDAFPTTTSRATAEQIVNSLPGIFDTSKGPVDLSKYISANGINIEALYKETKDHPEKFLQTCPNAHYLSVLMSIKDGKGTQTQKDIAAYCQELFGASPSSAPKALPTKPATPPSESDSPLSPVTPTIVDEKTTPEKTGPTLFVADLNGKINDYKEKQTNMMTELKDAGFQLVPKPDWTEKEVVTFKACLVEANNSKNYETLKNEGWIKDIENQRPNPERIEGQIKVLDGLIPKEIAGNICRELADLKGNKEFGLQFKNAKFEENGGHVYYVNNSRRVPFTVSKGVLSVDLVVMNLPTAGNKTSNGNDFSTPNAPDFLWGLEAFAQAFGYARQIDARTDDAITKEGAADRRPFAWKEGLFEGLGSMTTGAQSQLFSFTNKASYLTQAMKNMPKTADKNTSAESFATLLNTFDIWTIGKTIPLSITESGKEEGSISTIRLETIQSREDLVGMTYDQIKLLCKEGVGDMIQGVKYIVKNGYIKLVRPGLQKLRNDIEKSTTYIYEEDIVPGFKRIVVDGTAGTINLLNAAGTVMKCAYDKVKGFAPEVRADLVKAMRLAGDDVGQMLRDTGTWTVDSIVNGGEYIFDRVIDVIGRHSLLSGYAGRWIMNQMGLGAGWRTIGGVGGGAVSLLGKAFGWFQDGQLMMPDVLPDALKEELKLKAPPAGTLQRDKLPVPILPPGYEPLPSK